MAPRSRPALDHAPDFNDVADEVIENHTGRLGGGARFKRYAE
jgi:hypothetical protein